jgi:hypothetical protein
MFLGKKVPASEFKVQRFITASPNNWRWLGVFQPGRLNHAGGG